MECQFRCDQLQREEGAQFDWGLQQHRIACYEQLHRYECDERDDLLLRRVGGEYAWGEREFGAGLGDAERAGDQHPGMG